MSTPGHLSEDSDTEIGCYTPSSSSSGLTQHENMNDTTGNMLLSFGDQPTNLVATGTYTESGGMVLFVSCGMN